MDRLTMTSDKGGLAFTFDLDFRSQPSEARKILALGERLKAYEDAEEQGLLVRLPCKVGDAVYVVADCADVMKFCDDDYFTGTGAIDCPFEKDCEFTECDDSNRKVFSTECTGFWLEKDGQWKVFLDYITSDIGISDIGKTVFLTREEAERKRKENT